MEQIYNFFSATINETFKIIFTAICTYLITNYSLNSPHQLSILQKQFDLVYVPLRKLFLVTEQELESDDIFRNLQLSKTIFFEHFEYVDIETFELFHQLTESIDKNRYSNSLYSRFIDAVFRRYAFLRKKLGYPSLSAAHTSKRSALSFSHLRRSIKINAAITFMLIMVSMSLIFLVGIKAVQNGDQFGYILIGMSVGFILYFLKLFI